MESKRGQSRVFPLTQPASKNKKRFSILFISFHKKIGSYNSEEMRRGVYWGVYISIDQCPIHAILLTLMMGFENSLLGPFSLSIDLDIFYVLFFILRFVFASRSKLVMWLNSNLGPLLLDLVRFHRPFR